MTLTHGRDFTVASDEAGVPGTSPGSPRPTRYKGQVREECLVVKGARSARAVTVLPGAGFPGQNRP